MAAEYQNFDRQTCPTCSAVFGSAYDLCPNDGTTLIPGGEDELLGVTLANKYVIDECIGEGGMGRVYRAHHSRLTKRVFAIKILLGDLAADPTMRRRFEQEAEIASRLQHPNVVPVLDFGKSEGGLLYLVMEFVSGQPLSEIIKAGPLPESRVIAITQELCNGLAHAHSEGLVHRDFKPDNIVISGEEHGGTPRILDFGLAIVRSAEEASVRLTGSGMMVGTPAYISPEQARAASVDQRTDLFSLGITVYEMLAGRLPFSGDAIEIMYANTKLDPPAIASRNPAVSVSPEMEAIVRKLMAREAEERFQSATEVLALLSLIDGSAASTSGDPRLASLVAAIPASSDSVRTVRNGTPLVVDSLSDAPTLKRQSLPEPAGQPQSQGPNPRNKGKTVGLAVAAVLLVGFAVFALLHFGATEAVPGDLPNEPQELGAASVDVVPAIAPLAATSVAPPEEPVEAKAPGPIELEPTLVEMPTDTTSDGQGAPNAEDRSAREIRARKQGRRTSDRKSRRMPSADESQGASKAKDPTPALATPAEPAPAVVSNSALAPATTAEPAPVVPAPVPKLTPLPKPAPKAPVAKVFDAKVSIQEFSARGSLSSRVVRRAVERALPDIRSCYKNGSRRAKRNTAAAISVRMRINELGRAANIKASGFPLSGVSECVSQRLRSLRTRVVPDVGTVSVSLSLAFTPMK